MNLPKLNTLDLFKKYRLRPDKKLGQNFLTDPVSLEKIITAADINPQDVVLEIGPGFGSLSRYIATIARTLVCVELDIDLIPPLESVLSQYSNVRIIQADILQLIPDQIVESNDYLVVANVPYYITSAIFRHLLAAKNKPRRIVFTIQKEVAKRICAKPGDMSLMALSIQIFGEPRIIDTISAESFYPVPKVDSAIIRVDVYTQPIVPSAILDTFFKISKAGFSQKRKTLRNSLSAGLQISSSEAEEILEKSKIDPMRRAETLSIPEWEVLSVNYRQFLEMK